MRITSYSTNFHPMLSNEASADLFKLFDDNEMQANGSNCHVLIKSTHQKVQVNIGTARIENSKS